MGVYSGSPVEACLMWGYEICQAAKVDSSMNSEGDRRGTNDEKEVQCLAAIPFT